jgi:hypothetical protein
MKYWVTMDTSYNVYSVEEIDERLKDGETKGADNLNWPITEPVKSFLKGGVVRVTCSGNLNIEVEADSEEEARRIAPLECLKKRVKDLEESLHRNCESKNALLEGNKKLIDNYSESTRDFLGIIRSGELTLVNTGKRIIGTWFDVEGEKEFECLATVNFKGLVEHIKNSSVKYNNCY